MERPSGVSSDMLDSSALVTSRCMSTPAAGMNSVAWRLPWVMVPVLSSSRVSTSPAASTARPDMASTLRCMRRSMPAMPMALSSPPMVVGMRHTSRAISTVTVTEACWKVAKGCSVTTANMKMMVSPASRMLSAISLGVFCREADSKADDAIEEGLPGVLGDLHDDAVAEHLGSAGDGAPVATRLADDGRRLPGDRRLVHRGDALGDGAV